MSEFDSRPQGRAPADGDAAAPWDLNRKLAEAAARRREVLASGRPIQPGWRGAVVATPRAAARTDAGPGPGAAPSRARRPSRLGAALTAMAGAAAIGVAVAALTSPIDRATAPAPAPDAPVLAEAEAPQGARIDPSGTLVTSAPAAAGAGPSAVPPAATPALEPPADAAAIERAARRGARIAAASRDPGETPPPPLRTSGDETVAADAARPDRAAPQPPHAFARARPPGPAEIEARLAALEQSLALDRAARREVQARLRLAGHDPGPADGVLGPRTRAALLEWQSVRGHHPSGWLNAAALDALDAETDDDQARLIARMAARTAPPASGLTEPEPAAPPDACARGEDGVILTGRGVRCDLIYLREDLLRLVR